MATKAAEIDEADKVDLTNNADDKAIATVDAKLENLD